MIRNFLFLSCVFLTLSGCTTSNEYFDCPAKGGVGCKSISEVNQLLNQQQIALAEERGQSSTVLQEDSVSPPNPKNKIRIWCAPYEDERGNAFDEVIIQTPIDSNITAEKGAS